MTIELVDAMAAESAYVPALAKMLETMTGFDRESAETGGKELGILQYCHDASTQIVHQIGSDKKGLYVELTGQTTFADGTALADRTLMHAPDSGESSFKYWHKGILHTVTEAKFIQLAADFEGYIYYNDEGDLDNTITTAHTLIVSTVLVAFLYLNSTENEVVWYGDERHGMVEDGQTHLALHKNQGFFVASGLELNDVDNNDTNFTGISAGACGDEDVKAWFDSITTTCPFMYMEGSASEWRITNNDSKFGINVAGTVRYNDLSGTPTLTTIGSDRVIMMFLASNNKLAPIVKLVGQNLHASRNDARERVQSEWLHTVKEGLPGPELQPIASVIVNNSSNGTAEPGADGETWYDMRFGGSVKRFPA